MVRMQIQLTEDQASELRRQAAVRRTSIAAVVREAVDRELERSGSHRDAWERALSAIGKYRGDGADVSVEHDAYLDEAWGH